MSQNSFKKVCVAVKFDESSKQALKIAEQYCLRTGAEMHLVHVCENFMTGTAASLASSSIVPVPMEVIQIVQENMEEDADKNLYAVRKELSSKLRISSQVVVKTVGSPAESISQEAEKSKCDMIIVGAKPTTHRFIPRGISCALSLVSSSNVPVLVASDIQTQDLSTPTIDMLIADDLKPTSNAAITDACLLATKLRKTNIHHIHINGMTSELLTNIVDTAMAASHTRAANISGLQVFKELKKQLEVALETRVDGQQKAFSESDCNYHRELVTAASVTKALSQFVDDKKINLAVFGRHQSIQHKPFGIGQMPFYAMLSLHCPVLVCPANE